MCIVFFSFGFISCNQKNTERYQQVNNGNKITIKKTVYKNDSVFTEQILDIDSIPDGIYKEYKYGMLTCVGLYKNGKKDSTWTNYLLNSKKTIKLENWFNGSMFGIQKEFYNNGKLRKYQFNNIEGKIIFEASFDTRQNLSNIDGFPLYVAYNKNRLKVGERFDWICFFGDSLPNHSINIGLIEYNKKNNGKIFYKNISEDSSVINLPFSRKYLRSKIYYIPGIYDWVLNYSLKDSNRKIILSDTMHFFVKVEMK